MSLGPGVDLFDSKTFTHLLCILESIHKYLGGVKPSISYTQRKFKNLKYSLMPIGASRYNILKTIYKIST